MSGPNDGRGNPNWRKASRSVNHGACAEVSNGGGAVAVRDSTDRQRSVALYSVDSWRAFVAAAKAGSYDSLRYS